MSLIAKNETNLTSNKVSYYHPDHLGSTNLITDKNDSVVEKKAVAEKLIKSISIKVL